MGANSLEMGGCRAKAVPQFTAFRPNGLRCKGNRQAPAGHRHPAQKNVRTCSAVREKLVFLMWSIAEFAESC